MELVKYCGRERLPGGERRWRRLARAVGFTGRVQVFGYGVGGGPGAQQRRAGVTGQGKGITLADFEPGLIRVWLPCSCAVVKFTSQKQFDYPLPSFAHELGHHIQHNRRRANHEAVAERYGRLLLAHVP